MKLYEKVFRRRRRGASSGSASTSIPKAPRPQQQTPEADSPQAESAQASSLWTAAADQLQPKDKNRLRTLLNAKQTVESGQKLDPTMAGIHLVISRTLELQDDDRMSSVRPVLDKIIKAALAVKKVGDAAAELDKSGYAAVGWSVISAALQIAVNAEAARQFVLTSSEFTAALLTRYAEYETDFRGPLAGDKFDRHLTDVYKSVLLYILALDEFLNRCAAGRIGRAIGSIDDRTISQTRAAVVEADEIVQKWIPIIAFKSQKHDVQLLQAQNQGPAPNLLAARGCSKSLAFLDMEARCKDIKTATEGTCSWLLSHPTYQKWIASDRGLLWIKGKPGSGKSTLLRYLLDQTSADLGRSMDSNDRPSVLILSFFFHGRGFELQKTPIGLFRTVLYQLLQQAPETLQDLVTAYEGRCQSRGQPGKDWQWHLRELKDFLLSALRRVLMIRPVRLFVDALDEGGRDSAGKLVSWFKDLLKNPTNADAAATGFPCHVCFTCRHFPILSLDSGLEICVERENGQDIARFVQDELSESQISPDLIIQRADGIFLWCHLVMEKLRLVELDGSVDINEAIQNIPPRLDDLYLGLVDSMEKKAESLRLMQWVCFSYRPLTLYELCWAMAMSSQCPHRSLEQCQDNQNCVPDKEMFKRRLRSLSGGLIETVQSVKDGEPVEVVQFIHQSARDFAFSNGLLVLMNSSGRETTVEKSRISDRATNAEIASVAHYQMARSCLRYLGMDEFHDGTVWFYSTAEQLPLRFPLGSYSLNWIYHAKLIEETRQGDLMDFLGWPSDAIFRGWAMLCRDIRPSKDLSPQRSEVQHIAARYGIIGLLRAILERSNSDKNIDIDARDINYKTPLFLAAEYGHESAARILLTSNKVDPDAEDYNRRTPLSQAARDGHENVVQLLLDCPRDQVEVDWRDGEGSTPLAMAAYFGHDSVVRILLDKGKADADLRDFGGRTPLMQAAAEGQEAVVQLLLNTGGVDADAKDDNCWTPLVWAARRGNDSIVRMLLGTGKVDVDYKDVYGRTTLSWTAEYGHEAVVRTLINMGKADINTMDDEGETPLSWVIKEGCSNVMESRKAEGWFDVMETLLRDKRIEINSRNSKGRTPLFLATEAGNEAVVRRLLRTGKADVDAADKEGETALCVASKQGHSGIVQLLRPFSVEIRPQAERNDSMATTGSDSVTVVGESVAGDGEILVGRDSFSVKERFATVDSSFAAVSRRKLSVTDEERIATEPMIAI